MIILMAAPRSIVTPDTCSESFNYTQIPGPTLNLHRDNKLAMTPHILHPPTAKIDIDDVLNNVRNMNQRSQP